ncbi:transcriptional regulator, partial [Salmonella enterica subsp. enterica serovar Heidelberg]|nr:transcriptional regulator [Salmonella enterica subsp. enterica serovar Heidelberg]
MIEKVNLSGALMELRNTAFH